MANYEVVNPNNSPYSDSSLSRQPQPHRVEFYLPGGGERRLLREIGIRGRLGSVYNLVGEYILQRVRHGKSPFPILDNGLYDGSGAKALLEMAMHKVDEQYRHSMQPMLYGIDINGKSIRRSEKTLGQYIKEGTVHIMQMDATAIDSSQFPRCSMSTCIEVLGVGLKGANNQALQNLFQGISEILEEDGTVFITYKNEGLEEQTRAHTLWAGGLKGHPLKFQEVDALADKFFRYRDWYGQMLLTDLGPGDPSRGVLGGTVWPYQIGQSDPENFYLPNAFVPVPLYTFRYRETPAGVVPINYPIYYIGVFSPDPNMLKFPNAHLHQVESPDAIR
ncbi:MAG: hypothetical protein N2691_01845 [Patescibacteria group bacterium]|nr:hypothetical protein [Patescibacteria group bacterium]